MERDGPAALESFLSAATALVGDRVPDWRRRWQQQAVAVAALTGATWTDWSWGNLATCGMALRVSQPQRRYGMCGWLTTCPTT